MGVTRRHFSLVTSFLQQRGVGSATLGKGKNQMLRLYVGKGQESDATLGKDASQTPALRNIAEHSPERCSRRAPHRADGVRRLLRPPRERPKLRSPHRPSLTRARRCSGTESTRRTAHGGTGEPSQTRRRSAPPSPSSCLSRLSSVGLAGAARVAAGDPRHLHRSHALARCSPGVNPPPRRGRASDRTGKASAACRCE